MPFVSDAKKMASFQQYKLAGDKEGKKFLGYADNIQEERQIEWTTIFRYNPGIYAEWRLKMKLLPYQHYMLWQMFNSQVTFDMCSRNSAKTYVLGLGAVIRCLLFPNTEVVITASTIDQANKMIERKIRDEIIMKHSEVLRRFLELGMIQVKRDNDVAVVLFPFNGSSIRVLPMVDSARGERCTWLILEEAMQLKKHIISAVFNPMRRPRQIDFMRTNEEFKKQKRWVEQAKTTYITSNRFKSDWAYKDFTNCVVGYYMSHRVSYKVFAFDIFNVIEEGLKTEEYLLEALKNDSELVIRQELYNEAIGEAEDAFFSYKSFKNNQIIEHAFNPPSEIDLYVDKDMGNAPKKDNELRLVITDYAFANTTSRETNDNTIIMLMSLHWKGNRFERHVDYIEGHEASDSLGSADRARELFWDYDADYFIPDLRSGGETLYNKTTMQWEPNKSVGNRRINGLTISTEKDLQVLPDNKLQDLIERTVDKNAMACMIPIIGTGDLNSAMWMELRRQLDSNNIKFLINTQDKQTQIENDGSYFDMSSEEFAETIAPYGQVDLMIQEAVNLSAEFKDGRVRLKEPRMGTKDRAICLSYGNYIASKLENKYNQSMQEDNLDIDDIQLVF
nr:MAG TPA: large terminase [Caudoviricetes sp.]